MPAESFRKPLSLERLGLIVGTEQTKPDEAEVARILSALDKLSELESKDPKKYQGLPVFRHDVDDTTGVERILSLGDYFRKADYWAGLIETGGCEVVKWSPGQYTNRYKLVDRRNRAELLLVEPSYGRVVPLCIMPTE
ncbi:MAG: hypothetical protein ABIA12_02755 [Candidatus Aenigmatarchaeota archaeon]